MNKQYMPAEKRNCPHCGVEDDTLAYYHENSNGNDWYWCNECYGITEWDGQDKKAINGEAYPDRDK